MQIGVPLETYPGERRVALVPGALAPLRKAGFELLVEAGAGASAGFPDHAYQEAGAAVSTRGEVFRADIVAVVRALGANPERWRADLELARPDQIWIGMADPLSLPGPAAEAAQKGISLFALELIPRITRAQSMDVLSSQANLAGYKAVILAAEALGKIFPMMMTAAGTITPSRVLVIGAGVAGLQAIATARRLGAVVSGYDVRSAVKEQVQSLGARFVELEIESAEGEGGYARAMDAAYYARQAELLGAVIAEQDVVIATAAVPGQKAPVLIPAAVVERMRPGSVIVDLAAERGGNCEVTRPGEAVEHAGVQVLGPLNVPSTVAFHASQLYARNITSFLAHLAPKGELNVNREDEITAGALVTWQGEVVHPRVRERLGLPAQSSTE